jgi:F-type H+-transporting ATPase subunit epsilon
MKFRLEIVTPERLVYSQDVDVLSVPTTQGEISILAKHVPLVTIISPGEIKIKNDNETEYIAITGGFVEVLPHNVIILADAAERAEEIDLERAMKARERAQKLMEEKRGDKIANAEAMAAFQRALIRIKVGQRKRKR